MNIKIESKTTIETIAYFDGTTLKTHACNIGDWWGDETCDYINLTKEIETAGLPKGEYKISILIERISD